MPLRRSGRPAGAGSGFAKMRGARLLWWAFVWATGMGTAHAQYVTAQTYWRLCLLSLMD
jgi:predicted nicotinamide N-methyase